MRFSVNLKNNGNGKLPTSPPLAMGENIRMKIELAWWGLSWAMSDQPATRVQLVGHSHPGKQSIPGDLFELELHNPDMQTRLDYLFCNMRRQLTATGMALMAMLSFNGTSPATAGENTNPPLVHRVTPSLVKSSSPVIRDFDLELLYRGMENDANIPLLLARTHTNDAGSHTNSHDNTSTTEHINTHTNTTGIQYHTDAHGDHINTSHSDIPGTDDDVTTHDDGMIWENSPPQHANYNWENVAHSNQHMHTNLSDSSINSDYIY